MSCTVQTSIATPVGSRATCRACVQLCKRRQAHLALHEDDKDHDLLQACSAQLLPAASVADPEQLRSNTPTVVPAARERERESKKNPFFVASTDMNMLAMASLLRAGADRDISRFGVVLSR